MTIEKDTNKTWGQTRWDKEQGLRGYLKKVVLEMPLLDLLKLWGLVKSENVGFFVGE